MKKSISSVTEERDWVLGGGLRNFLTIINTRIAAQATIQVEVDIIMIVIEWIQGMAVTQTNTVSAL